MPPFFIDTSGRWSSGGSVVLNNLMLAADTSDGLLATAFRPDAIPLIPRNAPTSWVKMGRRFVWMPQNALPWGPPAPAERVLQRKLRVVSEIARLRATAMVRISSALPPLMRGSTSPVLHNVLDEAFEGILEHLIPEDTGAFITAGSAHSYRNLSVLARGYALYRTTGGQTPMVIQLSIGSPSEKALVVSLGAEIDGLEVRETDASRQTVANLMAGARGVILSSSVEASPVTLLEAQAIGVRVTCSDILAHREMTQTECAFFDPTDPRSISVALHLLDDGPTTLQNELSDPAFRHLQRMRWTQALINFLAAIDV